MVDEGEGAGAAGEVRMGGPIEAEDLDQLRVPTRVVWGLAVENSVGRLRVAVLAVVGMAEQGHTGTLSYHPVSGLLRVRALSRATPIGDAD